MSISFGNSTEVFIFIILCSVYVCSILWIYGDAATRDMGIKGTILPLIFVIAAALALTKGMMVAARTLATTAIDLLSNSVLIEDAREELIQRRGVDFQYRSLLGERPPPLDFRL